MRNLEICLNTCELDPVETHSAPGLAWQAALKEHLSKIRSFNRYRHVRHVANGRKR